MNPEEEATVQLIQMAGEAETLDLRFRPLPPTALDALLDLLSSSDSLRELDLWKTDLGDQGAVFLAEVLRKNISLSALDVGENNIMQVGLQALLEVLAIPTAVPRLHTLCLAKNTFGDSAGNLLSEYIMSPGFTLQSLNLNDVALGTSAACAIADAIAQRGETCPLHEISLYRASIGPRAATRFIEAARVCPNLTRVDLRMNLITDESLLDELERILGENADRLETEAHEVDGPHSSVFSPALLDDSSAMVPGSMNKNGDRYSGMPQMSFSVRSAPRGPSIHTQSSPMVAMTPDRGTRRDSIGLAAPQSGNVSSVQRGSRPRLPGAGRFSLPASRPSTPGATRPSSSLGFSGVGNAANQPPMVMTQPSPRALGRPASVSGYHSASSFKPSHSAPIPAPASHPQLMHSASAADMRAAREPIEGSPRVKPALIPPTASAAAAATTASLAASKSAAVRTEHIDRLHGLIARMQETAKEASFEKSLRDALNTRLSSALTHTRQLETEEERLERELRELDATVERNEAENEKMVLRGATSNLEKKLIEYQEKAEAAELTNEQFRARAQELAELEEELKKREDELMKRSADVARMGQEAEELLRVVEKDQEFANLAREDFDRAMAEEITKAREEESRIWKSRLQENESIQHELEQRREREIARNEVRVREAVEEAKKEAESALNHARSLWEQEKENALRELERQIEALQREVSNLQSAELNHLNDFKRLEALNAEMKTAAAHSRAEITEAREQIGTLAERNKTLETENRSMNVKLAAEIERRADAERKIIDIEDASLGLSRENESLRSRVKLMIDIQGELAAVKSELKTVQSENISLTAEKDRLISANTTMESRIEEKTSEILVLEERLQRSEQKSAGAETEAQSKEQQLSIVRADLDALRENYRQLTEISAKEREAARNREEELEKRLSAERLEIIETSKKSDTQIMEYRTQVDRANARFEEVNEKLTQTKKRLEDTMRAAQEAEDIFRSQIAELQDSISQHREQLAETRTMCSSFESQVNTLENTNSLLQTKIERLLNDKQKDVETASSSVRLEMQPQISDLTAKVESLRLELATAQRKSERLQAEKSEQKTIADSYRAQIEGLESDRIEADTLVQKLNNLDKKLGELEIKKAHVDEKLGDAMTELKAAKDRIARQDRELSESQMSNEKLMGLVSELEGKVETLQVELRETLSEKDTLAVDRTTFAQRSSMLEAKNEELERMNDLRVSSTRTIEDALKSMTIRAERAESVTEELANVRSTNAELTVRVGQLEKDCQELVAANKELQDSREYAIADANRLANERDRLIGEVQRLESEMEHNEEQMRATFISIDQNREMENMTEMTERDNEILRLNQEILRLRGVIDHMNSSALRSPSRSSRSASVSSLPKRSLTVSDSPDSPTRSRSTGVSSTQDWMKTIQERVNQLSGQALEQMAPAGSPLLAAQVEAEARENMGNNEETM